MGSVFGVFAERVVEILGREAGFSLGRRGLLRRWRRDVERGLYRGGLRIRSGVQRGISSYDWREGDWRIEQSRMRLEEVDLRGVEIVPGAPDYASDEDAYLEGRIATVIVRLRTPSAELDWFLPASISEAAIRALQGAAGEPGL